MPQKVLLIIIAMIVVGLVILTYQKKKYFYIGTFISNKNGNNLVFDISGTGHYLLNRTIIPQSPDSRAFFKIEEGTYQKKEKFLQIKPDKQKCYLYKNVKELVQNNYYEQKDLQPEKYKILIENHELLFDNQKLKRLKKGKVISAKQFAKFKK